MQIHELNDYNGNLDSGAYFAIDDGNDTGKISRTSLFSNIENKLSQAESELNGRIDNIIAGGTAPSTSEIVDARRGANGVDYPSLGTAIRTQITDVDESLKSFAVDILGDSSYSVNASKSVTAGGGINANQKAIAVNIPAGTIYTITVKAPDDVLSGTQMSLYKFDEEEARTSIIGNARPNVSYDYKASINITGFSIYAPQAMTIGSGTITIEVEIQNITTNQIEAENIESGAYDNANGEAYAIPSYSRLVNPIICKAGTRITYSSSRMNAFEYDILTGQFIRSNGAWTSQYTTENDCALRLIWQVNVSSKNQIVNETIVAPPQGVIDKTALPINALKTLTELNTRRFIQSETIKTISHRGDYLRCHGMMCGASAVIAAKRNGYNIVENDVNITLDGKMVMWHDTTLAAIGDPSHSTKDYTLEQLKNMDFGSAYGSEFAGEKILTFAEWVLLCKEIGADCYIDFKITGDDFPDSLALEMVTDVKRYGMADHVTYLNNFAKIWQYQPGARIAILQAPTEGIIESYKEYLDYGEIAFNPASSELTSENALLALNNGFGLECYYVDYGNASESVIFEEIERVVSLGIQRISLDIYRVEDVFIKKYGL